jgi:hypothetical protein
MMPIMGSPAFWLDECFGGDPTLLRSRIIAKYPPSVIKKYLKVRPSLTGYHGMQNGEAA